MLWRGQRESGNIVDQRGIGAGTLVAGGGIGTVILALVLSFMGVDPRAVLNSGPPQTSRSVQQAPVQETAEEQSQRQFVAVVLADTEDVWHALFQQMGKTYVEPKLVLFRGQVRSGCGLASTAVGPFYCGEDSRVYLDLGFFDELQQKFGAPGEFARAYVVAHEVGHHVQHLLGTMDKIHNLEARASKREANALSVRLELQADFLAGVWAHHAQRMKKILNDADIDAGLRAASAVGDDRLQQEAQGYVVPDAFTHGTSAQRVKWFRRGWETGDLSQGDTFSASEL